MATTPQLNSSGFRAIFEKLPSVEPDPILGLTARYRGDNRPNKVNGSIGLFVDSEGNPLMPKVVQSISSVDAFVGYLPICGDAHYVELTNKRFGLGRYEFGIQTLGSTQAVRIALEFFKMSGGQNVIIPTPSWPNHEKITKALGLQVISIDHLNPSHSFNFPGILESIRFAKSLSCIILQPFCHNPTGVDMSLEQAFDINQAILARGGDVQLLLDCSYLGFRDREHEERILSVFTAPHFLAHSYSKNFGLYSRRTGALLLYGFTDSQIKIARENAENIIRVMNSSPPVDGAFIASKVLSDDEKFEAWKAEMSDWRNRILSLRMAFAESFQEPVRSLIISQHGLFSFIPTELLRKQLRNNKAAQESLIERHAFYAVQLPQGLRISIPGLRTPEIARLCGKYVADCVA